MERKSIFEMGLPLELLMANTFMYFIEEVLLYSRKRKHETRHNIDKRILYDTLNTLRKQHEITHPSWHIYFTKGRFCSESSVQDISLYFFTSSIYAFHALDFSSWLSSSFFFCLFLLFLFSIKLFRWSWHSSYRDFSLSLNSDWLPSMRLDQSMQVWYLYNGTNLGMLICEPSCFAN